MLEAIAIEANAILPEKAYGRLKPKSITDTDFAPFNKTGADSLLFTTIEPNDDFSVCICFSIVNKADSLFLIFCLN
jgi:hypothetical protein